MLRPPPCGACWTGSPATEDQDVRTETTRKTFGSCRTAPSPPPEHCEAALSNPDTSDLWRALRGQARACDDLGSPFTARLLRLAAERLQPGTPLTDRLFGWTGDITGTGASVPLRLAGALHALVLSKRDPALAAVYPPSETGDEALWGAISHAMAEQEAFIDRFVDSPPQTNEIARSAALIAAGHWLSDRFGLPLVLSELGASAGLNLNWDRYALDAGAGGLGPADAALTLNPEIRGTPPVAADKLTVASRRGVDRSPFDVSDPAQALRLRAYVWPDQFARLDRLTRALALPPNPVDAGDAAPWLAARLNKRHDGAVHMVYNTIAWQYFPDETKAACTSALAAAGSRATANAPLAHFQMEADGQTPGAGLSLRLWPGGEMMPMGRIDFHGRWLDWRAPSRA